MKSRLPVKAQKLESFCESIAIQERSHAQRQAFFRSNIILFLQSEAKVRENFCGELFIQFALITRWKSAISELHWALRLHSARFVLLNNNFDNINYYSNLWLFFAGEVRTQLFIECFQSCELSDFECWQKFNSRFSREVTAAILVYRTIVFWKKSFGNLILVLCKTWATFCHCSVHQRGLLSTWVKTKNSRRIS